MTSIIVNCLRLCSFAFALLLLGGFRGLGLGLGLGFGLGKD
jgi:hypothetical protein